MRNFINIINENMQILSEEAFMLAPDRYMNIEMNPSLDNFLKMYRNSKSQYLRGLIIGRNVYFWDGPHVPHKYIASFYGHWDYEKDCIEAHYDPNSEYIRLSCNYNQVRQVPTLMKLAESKYILFHSDTNGWVPGPEWLRSQS